ncbi:MAG: hypothetical protein QGI45_07285 [Myxococcota bacterium]|jgi:hypothetical protein|nr:hypothetical protein [Myxococcota bacterium]
MTSRSDGVDTIVDFGAGHGFNFTQQEFSAVMKGVLKIDVDVESEYAMDRINRIRRQRSKVHPMD